MSWLEAARALRGVLNSAFSAAGFAPPAVKTMVGWPIADVLLKDIRTKPAGINAHVGIYSAPKSARNTSRYLSDPVVVKVPPTGQLAQTELSPLDIEFLGTLTVGEIYFIVLNNNAFSYNVQAGDTKTDVIDGLITLIDAHVDFAAADLSASYPGRFVIGVQGPIYNIKTLVLGTGIVHRERGRIERELVITVWAATADVREKLANQVILSINKQGFLDSPDGCKMRIVYEDDGPTDLPMPSGIMRHDINATVEYPIVEVESGVSRVGYIILYLKPLMISPVESEIDYTCGSVGPLDQTTHSHLYETPLGARPGTVFTLTLIPKPGSLLLTHNLLPQVERIAGSTPGVNEYTLMADQITMGNTVGASDDLKARYEV